MFHWLQEFRHSSIGYVFWQYWIDVQDPRTAGWFLVNLNPYEFALLLISYILLAKKIGPRLMADRPPLNIKWIMLGYNISMAIINFLFVWIVVFHYELRNKFTTWHYSPIKDYSPQTVFEIEIGWWYYISKFLDLFDTMFFVLRKKSDTHVTFLHLYHHTVVPIIGYLCMKINPVTAPSTLFTLLNGTIHTIMYSYYALSTLGPAWQKYLWWKRYITTMQLGQFFILGLYTILFMIKQEGHPTVFILIGVSQPPIFFKMFYDFYKTSYLNKAKKKKI